MGINQTVDSGYRLKPLHDIHGSFQRQIAYYNQSATPCPDLEKTAGDAGLSSKCFSLTSLNDEFILSADIIWITLDTVPDIRWSEKLHERTEAERLNLIFELSHESLDSVCAFFSDCENVTFLAEPTNADRFMALAGASHTISNMLNSPVAEARDRQLEQLHSEVQRIAQLLARLNGDNSSLLGMAQPTHAARIPASPFIEDHVHAPARGFSAQLAPDPSVPSVSPRIVRSIIRQRRLRDEFFSGEMFADPAWDMLLDLYAAKLERMRVSVSSLCIAAAVPATTALRWIKTLTDTGVFDREADPHDGRRIFVTLSKDTMIAMNRYFARVSDEHLPI